MFNGISNFQIEEDFTNIVDEDINNNFVGVFPSNYMNKFIDHATLISGKKVSKMENINLLQQTLTAPAKGKLILNIEPKTDSLFFDSFGLDVLRHFIIQDDKKVLEKILFGTEQMSRTDNKIALVNIRFNLNACKNLSKKEFDALSDTTTNFFHVIQAFGNKLKLRDFVNIWMVEDRVQDLDSVTCAIFV